MKTLPSDKIHFTRIKELMFVQAHILYQIWWDRLIDWTIRAKSHLKTWQEPRV